MEEKRERITFSKIGNVYIDPKLDGTITYNEFWSIIHMCGKFIYFENSKCQF